MPVDSRFTDHILRAGINYKFGGPVVARVLISTSTSLPKLQSPGIVRGFLLRHGIFAWGRFRDFEEWLRQALRRVPTHQFCVRFPGAPKCRRNRFALAGEPLQYAPAYNDAIGDTMAAPIKFGVGQSVLRKEDDALIRGKGRYTDDLAPQAAMHALVLRSPHAHAKFTINATRARILPGVGAILTAEDVSDLGGLPCLFNLEVDPFTGPPYPILAHGEVRHVGDAVAFVVADTLDQARDAIEAIEVDWTPLPAAIGVANAVKKGAPQVWPDHPGNVLFDVRIGDKKATEAAFAKAHAVAEVSIVNPRVVTNFMETRAAVCEYDAKRDHLTLTVGSQGSHRLREIICRHGLEDAAREDAGDLPRCRRRLRHKAVSLPRICADRGRCAEAAQDGEMDRRSLRSFHGRRAGPRQHHHRADGARRGRQVPRAWTST